MSAEKQNRKQGSTALCYYGFTRTNRLRGTHGTEKSCHNNPLQAYSFHLRRAFDSGVSLLWNKQTPENHQPNTPWPVVRQKREDRPQVTEGMHDKNYGFQ